MARCEGRRAKVLVILLCISSSNAFVSSIMRIPRQAPQLPQHQARCRTSCWRSLTNTLKASATSPPEQHHQAPLGPDMMHVFAAGEKQRDADSTPLEGRPRVGGNRRGNDHGRRRPLLSIRKAISRTSSKVASYLVIMTTWLLFRFLLMGLNKVECHNRQGLLDAVFTRGDRGLLTVSNHMCVYDDPGLWSALVPFWRTGQKNMRWAMCTDDIYNASPLLRGILDAGKTLPIKRSRGMEQPLFRAFFQKLEQGEWGHIFAEGGIRQPWRFSRGEPILGDFKAGIGRLLLRSTAPLVVLPIYHIGMHQVAPESPIHKRGRGKLSKMFPNVGRSVKVYVGEPIDVHPIIKKCRAKIGDVRSLPWTDRSSKEEVECHREIAEHVREHVLKLEAFARKDYYGSNPDASPYGTAE